jgi:glucan 1,3-beta-glucosidase
MFFWSKVKPVSHPPLKGVNLGGWLVLERWISPSLFVGTSATDEYSLCKLPGAGIQSKIREHRDTFITKADFEWLKHRGIEAVRLPVGYWAFGDELPYMPTIDYIDKAFKWAEETGLYVLLDMHGAPGSQNGWDHSGRSGECAWASDERNVIKTLEVMNKLGKRYAKHPQLLGFELLNEPRSSVPKATLLRYYTAAYKMLRDSCGPNIWIVFHDSFRPWRWWRALRGGAYDNLLMDTHQYQVFNANDKLLDMAGHIRKTMQQVPRLLANMRRFHNIIVGEWSLALDPYSLIGLNPQQIEDAKRAYGKAQLLAYGQSSAWFYWTYHTEEGGAWSFRDSMEKGLFESFKQLD